MGTILHVDSSGRYEGSFSRKHGAALAQKLSAVHGAPIVHRDVAQGVEFVDEAWIGANFTAEEERSDAQKQRLAGSDALVSELKAADHIIIGSPIYNFGVPAALKAWVDQVCRARVTFKYGENGPEGLLKDKTVWLVMSSGGTALESEIDFATGYLRHVMGFVGLTDVRVVPLGRLMGDQDAAENAAKEVIAEAA
ncbi:MAG: NAD(P)H-dependent oxidoreductase [Pseudomonadota bacterium]